MALAKLLVGLVCALQIAAEPPTTTWHPGTTTVATEGPAPSPCHKPFTEVGDRCILLNLFESTTWSESRYVCQMVGADLVTLESLEFYGQLLDFLNNMELTGHDLWVGANDTVVEGQWEWLDGTPVRMGTPLWSIYKYNSYEQEPRGGTTENCGYLTKERFFYLDDASCDLVKSAVCQVEKNHLFSPQELQNLELWRIL